ncbi:hypothetical protein ACFOPQ_13310 [Deinococcus antarcticus]|uniref:Uncharacterized protein n=1 Tax=Deinococcus antarcticus TaxID=1298767 RepID=A0ABV8A9G3_9DEIO
MKKNALASLPLIAVAALPLTVGLVFAQTSGTAQAPQRVQPLQPGQSSQGQNQQGQNQQGQTQQNQRQQSGTNYGDVFIQKLAAQLGITVEKLKAAATAASKSTIDQGVKAGDFPADMAQNMTQRLQDDPFALAGGRGGRGGHGMHGDGDGDFGSGRDGPDGRFQGSQPGQQGQPQPGQSDQRMGRDSLGQAVTAAVAKALGLTEQQLFTQLQGGQTVAQIAQARGISTATLHTAAVEALKTGLATDVKAGRLTQAQADQRIAQAQADANFGLNFGRGGRGGGPRGQTNDTPDTAQGDALTG